MSATRLVLTKPSTSCGFRKGSTVSCEKGKGCTVREYCSREPPEPYGLPEEPQSLVIPLIEVKTMIEKEIVEIEGVADIPGPLNHVVRAGNFLFLSSQLSADLKDHRLIEGDIRQQTQKAMENIKFLLEQAGSSLEGIVKTVVYMKRVKEDFEGMNEVYQQFFKKGHEPARVTVQASSPLEGIDIEIEATAVVST